MNIINTLEITGAMTIVVAALICWAITQAIKMYTPVKNEYLPWLSMLVGIIAGIVSGLLFKDELFSSAVVGFLIGAATCGLFDGFSSFFGKEDK